MGNCCFNCDEEKLPQATEPTESTRLLNDLVRNDNQRPNHYNDESDSGRPPSFSGKGDEQSALNRILHQTATNVIDVSALDSHYLEKHEYMDRARQYNHKLTGANVSSVHSHKTPCLLADVPIPERLVTADLTPAADLQLIITAAEKAAKALSEVKVEHRDDLVVQFGIP